MVNFQRILPIQPIQLFYKKVFWHTGLWFFTGMVLIFLFPVEAKRAKKPTSDVQGACAIIKQLTEKELDLLQMLLEDTELTAEVKSCAVYQTGKVLAFYSQTEKNYSMQKQLSALQEIYQKHLDDRVNPQNYQVREAICYALAGFENSPESQKAIEFMGKIAGSDSHPTVVLACVTMLGGLTTHKALAAKSLIQILDQTLKQKEVEQKDITLVHLLVNALGSLEQAEAFVPLVRVLQSGYPVYVKKATERAIQNLESSSTAKK